MTGIGCSRCRPVTRARIAATLARAGIPVIASDLGGSPEVVIEGETGFLFDPSHPDQGLAALKSLLADPTRREAMGRAARARYETHFSPQQVVDGYDQLWKSLAYKSRR